jgi:hypothetical protein
MFDGDSNHNPNGPTSDVHPEGRHGVESRVNWFVLDRFSMCLIAVVAYTRVMVFSFSEEMVILVPCLSRCMKGIA